MVDKDERRVAMIIRAQEYIIVHGFSQLKIDDLTKVMGVSRAKLYQYFGSKDGVIEAVVKRYTDFVNDLSISDDLTDPEAFVAYYPTFFYQNVAYFGTTTDILLRELNEEYPSLYQAFVAGRTTRDEQMKTFYAAGVKQQVFQPLVNGKVVMLQDHVMIPNMFSRDFLFEQQMTLSQALEDYYNLSVGEVFLPKYAAKVWELRDEAQLPKLSTKFTRIFIN